jgi:hypothetical protein
VDDHPNGIEPQDPRDLGIKAKLVLVMTGGQLRGRRLEVV